MYTLNIEYDDETDDEVCREKKKKRRNNNSTFEKQIRLLMTELKEEKNYTYTKKKKINLPNYCNRLPILVLMFPRHSCSHLREVKRIVPHCLNRS